MWSRGARVSHYVRGPLDYGVYGSVPSGNVRELTVGPFQYVLFLASLFCGRQVPAYNSTRTYRICVRPAVSQERLQQCSVGKNFCRHGVIAEVPGQDSPDEFR